MGFWLEFQYDLIDSHTRCAMESIPPLYMVLNQANIKNEKSNGEKNEEMKCAPINSGSDVVSMCTVPVRVNKGNPSMKFKHMHFWTVAAKGHLY